MEKEIYNRLSTSAINTNSTLDFEWVEPAKRTEFISNFLNDRVEKNNVSHVDLINSHLRLDNCGSNLNHLLHKKPKKINNSNALIKLIRAPSKRKSLTSREKKDLMLFELKPDDLRYEMYIPLNELWNDYIRELLNFTKVTEKNVHEMEARLVKADFQGSIVKVTRTKCPSLIGATGIVLQETKHTFRIITQNDKLKVIPKFNTVFTTSIDGHVFTIHGNNFRSKAADRSTKRHKNRQNVDL